MTGPEAVDLGFARVDVGREARQGLPEVVYGTGKTAAEIASIVRTLLRHNDGPVLATRVEPETAAAVLAAVGDGSRGPADGDRTPVSGLAPVPHGTPAAGFAPVANGMSAGFAPVPAAGFAPVPHGTYDAPARLLVWRPAAPVGFTVVVAAAGTADQPVAREAAAIATAVGLTVTSVTDVGVAGLHRLLAEQDRLRAADTVIVVAGMEGALASAIGGLVACPVVAVPTSTGYGAGLEGITALLAMHASCAAGITVVNIDSGFGAAMAAFRLSRVARRSAS
ncbi:1-(5-phosphoribosyl)-5-amino-4-imidazole-carboxylate carboxylase [Lentzea aerocolonigenes]|uniref:1-(5-phosphoribosyl)-5-amino-4-imidazole-carboxylate carboxylase n=1 Tax=Lentzea aerocolonigenes TaxID=68170 RepID=A0A0F0GKG8_LENAE|nr:nickel pincer cofactor biosynthesis protein LarB [Lentzea aerocolonigenes]KJK43066.1 1-(5-phosphoribosyl)-5-amino-4-imidazole-carboxylate carboxylase [Lentzea aerocolonigenes]